MPGKFEFKKFSAIDIGDPFFDELKADYPGTATSTGFEAWFAKKAEANDTALIFDDDDGIGAFIALKDEDEELELATETLPAVPRLKISTLRLAPKHRGQRLGEGALGLILWQWKRRKQQEVYVTVFEKHDLLIGLFEHFGFKMVGKNPNGELVYLRSRVDVDYSDPYKAFPFINPAFQKAGYVLVEDYYHDTLFPYSELKGELQKQVGLSVANGISKIYVGKQFTPPHYQVGEPVLIYRKYNGTGTKRYKSCITSYCIVTDIILVKTRGQFNMAFEDLLARIGNKSVFDERDLLAKYQNDNNVVVIEMLYYGYFGEGNNVNMDWLDKHSYWAGGNEYPTEVQLSSDEFKQILTEGNVNVSDVIIN
ncbi:MAG: GNAT family N-acetyltransferase [Coriobacteriales bacterium]|jgi:GNAT superfamily N-acetyltransferase|nr:GNAT family N-acetyltransferase [Coriobacteriales bacterium]